MDPLGSPGRRRLTEREHADARVRLGVGALQQVGRELGHHRQEAVDERGVEVAPALRLTLRGTGYLSAALLRGLKVLTASTTPATVLGMGGAAAREV